MTDQDLIGEKVVSPIYGEGRIESIDGEKLQIIFDRSSEVKKFTFSAFLPEKVSKPMRAQREEVQEYLRDRCGIKEHPIPVDILGDVMIANVDQVDRINPFFHTSDNDKKTTYSRALPRTLDWLKDRVYIPRNGIFITRGLYITATELIAISVVNTESGYYVYHDRWIGVGEYLYSGEGKIGDQKETARNKAMINAIHEHRPVRLLIFDYSEFRRINESLYYDQGLFQVMDYEYSTDYGENKKLRKEYKFRLKKLFFRTQYPMNCSMEMY